MLTKAIAASTARLRRRGSLRIWSIRDMCASRPHRAPAVASAQHRHHESEDGDEDGHQRDIDEGQHIAEEIDVAAQIGLNRAKLRTGFDKIVLEALDLSG